jgi:hypothetical protein
LQELLYRWPCNDILDSRPGTPNPTRQEVEPVLPGILPWRNCTWRLRRSLKSGAIRGKSLVRENRDLRMVQ